MPYSLSRSFSAGHIIRIQSLVRGFLVRKRLGRVRQLFISIAKEIENHDKALDWLERVCAVKPERTGQKCLSPVSSTGPSDLPEEKSNEASLPSLYKARNELFLEVLWLDQAIKSRIDFLRYKEKFDESLTSSQIAMI
ncbi:hypothetical protein D915_006313 [Fasciola hepatica]|uniref:Uncharacterized protein n=1 Tax=Fasciola hepatica TaxID=6192 RepID=A0A4E0RR38_FASHE|nr:hypothetical protein D915_006313 [Fasciola hepatica]